jgi:hypothetical protein
MTKYKMIFAALALLMTSGAAMAGDEPASDGLTYSVDSLLMMLASEQACKLNYKPDAVEHYMTEMLKRQNTPVQEGVQPRGVTFPDLPGQVALKKFSVDQMTKSTLIAHCTQVRITAKNYGWLQ